VAIGLFLGPLALMLWIGRWRWGVFYLLTTFAVIAAFIALPVFGIVNPLADVEPTQGITVPLGVVGIIAIVHAIAVNRGGARPAYSRWYIAFIMPLVGTFAIAIAIRQWIVQPFSIPSNSNAPTLIVGDRIFVSKITYRTRPPAAGDMAVFKYPKDQSVDYVKRVVGVPGDKIQMIDGVLNINGVPVKREQVQLAPYLSTDEPQTFFRETLPNGRSYITADMGDTPLDHTDVFVVSEGQYFVLGDNRDNSSDSRVMDKVGFVPAANFIGPVVSLFWNDRGLPLTDRPPFK